MDELNFNGSIGRSTYDGTLPTIDKQNPATHLAFFHVAPSSKRKIAPFSSFPRHVAPGTPTRMAFVSLRCVDNLLSLGAKLYHVGTTPSQRGRWDFRTYQTHVVVVQRAHVPFYSNLNGCTELNPDLNGIFCRKKNVDQRHWAIATRIREAPNDSHSQLRRVQVVLAFSGGLRLKDRTCIHWVDSFKLKSVGRGNERRLECPLCPKIFPGTKGLSSHFRTTHMVAKSNSNHKKVNEVNSGSHLERDPMALNCE